MTGDDGLSSSPPFTGLEGASSAPIFLLACQGYPFYLPVAARYSHLLKKLETLGPDDSSAASAFCSMSWASIYQMGHEHRPNACDKEDKSQTSAAIK